MIWVYTSVSVQPGESHHDVLRKMGREGWEAWHIEKTHDGWREVFFKKPEKK